MSLPAPNHSFKRLFTQGIVSGIGWAVGTTIGFALLIAVLGAIFSALGHVPFLSDIINPFVQMVDEINNPQPKVRHTNPTEFDY